MSSRQLFTWQRVVALVSVGSLVGAFFACSSGSDPEASGGGGNGSGSGGTGFVKPVGDAAPGYGDGGVFQKFFGDPWKYFKDETKQVWGYKDPAAPDDARKKFGGPASDVCKPSLIYPTAGSLLPNNMGFVTVQWTLPAKDGTTECSKNMYGDGLGFERFRIQAKVEDKTYEFYPADCTSTACSFELPIAEWYYIGRNSGGKSVTLTVSGTNGSVDNSPVASSGPVALTFSPEPVHGQLYYWAAASRAIKRGAFGAKGSEIFIAPDSKQNEFACVACHSVSRDGTVIAFAVASETPNNSTNRALTGSGENRSAIQFSPILSPDTPTVKPTKGTSPWPTTSTSACTVCNEWGGWEGAPSNQTGHNVALSPNGDRALVNGVPEGVNFPMYLEFRDTKTGASVTRHKAGDAVFKPGDMAVFPEFSPDGKSVAVTLAVGGKQLWASEVSNGSIAVMPANGTTLGTPQVIVPGSKAEMHFYPTWSPDGKWLAFVTAPIEAGIGSQKTVKGRLRIVRATPGSTPVDLTVANGTQVDRKNTWPKFTPFGQGVDGKTDELFFLSFTSKRDYGSLARFSNQIWIAGIDMKKVAAGQDGSYAAVWIPFQNSGDSALTPYWSGLPPCDTTATDAKGNKGCKACVGKEECLVDEQANTCTCVNRGIL